MDNRLPDGRHVIWTSQSLPTLQETMDFGVPHTSNTTMPNQSFDVALNRQMTAGQGIQSYAHIQYGDDPGCIRLQFAIPQYTLGGTSGILSATMPTMISTQGHTPAMISSQGHTQAMISTQGHTQAMISTQGHTPTMISSQGHTQAMISSQGYTQASQGHTPTMISSQGHTPITHTFERATPIGDIPGGHVSRLTNIHMPTLADTIDHAHLSDYSQLQQLENGSILVAGSTNTGHIQSQTYPVVQPLILPQNTNHILHGVSPLKESDLMSYTTMLAAGHQFPATNVVSSGDNPESMPQTLLVRTDISQRPHLVQMPNSNTGVGQFSIHPQDSRVANVLDQSLTPNSSIFPPLSSSQTFDMDSASSPTSLTLQLMSAPPLPQYDATPQRETSESSPPMSYKSGEFSHVRKSDRIATRTTEILPKKRKYVPKAYNVKEIWCEECKTAYEDECLEHRLTIISDKMVLSRAWASLPSLLEIFRFGQSTDLGVFVKRSLAKNTQFGPLTGELIANKADVSSRIIIMLEKDTSVCSFFNLVDENQCNWMMFVRPAENYSEQNLVMYQHGNDIFYTVCRNIEPKQELKVWYAQHYAERLGVEVHPMTEQDREEQEQEECKWVCFECQRRFKTNSLLDRHMGDHEETHGGADVDHSEFGTVNQNLFSKKKRGRPSKMLKEMGDGKFLSWKKRTTNLYLNKTLKKYQRRHDSEAIKRTIKSLYRRRRGGRGVFNTWVCLHCGLTFNNSSLLNLHTLTHAAEDVGMSEWDRYNDLTAQAKLGDLGFTDPVESNGPATLSSPLTCPVCFKVFDEKVDLIEHASEHAMPISNEKPNMCPICYKNFTNAERLQRHMFCHGDARDKPFSCNQCLKRFMTNSALCCHLKTHMTHAYYDCPLCGKSFSRGMMLKDHVKIHEVEGFYHCRRCVRKFPSYKQLKKHLNSYHSDMVYTCTTCGKVFCTTDKLKVHMLRHSSVRDFMCDTCGKQFKRKDKLNEHIKRMHSKEKEEKLRREKQVFAARRRFIPKVSPNDYHRFIYKCHSCLLGFKRRGMLINHLVKRHPDVPLDTVPELNMPILKEQKDFYCQYCEKIYKSSSKRKTHILKKHPGATLPLSKRSAAQIPEIPGLPNATYSQTVGSVTTLPHLCEFCHKQYASRAKMLQHQRSKHPEYNFVMRPTTLVENIESTAEVQLESAQQTETVHVTINAAGTHSELSNSDLLTQAMSELSQTFGEAGAARILSSQNIVSVPSVQAGNTTIELSAPFTQAIVPNYHHIQNLTSVPIGELKQADVEVAEMNDTAAGSATTNDGQNTFANIPIVIAPNSFLQKNNWSSYVYRT